MGINTDSSGRGIDYRLVSGYLVVLILLCGVLSSCGNKTQPVTSEASESPPPFSQTTFTEISSSEAARHIGERCTVEGYVANIHATAHGTVFLDFDKAYPRQTFTAVSLHSELAVGDLRQFAQHTVRVSGTVEDYKGKPEIILHSLSQISVVK